MKKVLILSSSFRKNSNSERLAAAFAEGANAAGHAVELVTLSGKSIGFCHGCGVCHKTHTCVQKDDAAAIAGKIAEADVVVLATPVYYYSMCGQLKTLLDRTNPYYETDYRFRDVYLLATAQDTDDCTFDGTLTGVMGWISCFPKARLAGIVRGYGLDGTGEVGKRANLLREAIMLGKSC